MTYVYILLILLVPIYVLPFLRISYKRIYFFSRLLYLSSKYKNIKIIITSPFWLFGLNTSKKPELYVLAGNKLYLLKLCSTFRKRTIIEMISPHNWILHKYSLLHFHGLITPTLKTKNIKFNLKEEKTLIESRLWSLPEIQEVKTVLLFCPVPLDIKFRSSGSGTSITNGDVVWGSEIYSGSGFINIIKMETEERETVEYKNVVAAVRNAINR